jgi:fused signal recognition particle receptor
VRYRRRRISLSSADTATPVDRSGGYTASSGITFSQSAPAEPVERIDTSGLPAVGDDATIPRDAPKRTIADVQLPEAPVAPPVPGPEPAAAPVEEIAPVEGRLDRLRGRLAKSQNTLGRGVLGLLGGGDLDEESWEAVEDTLLIADLGPVVTESVVSSLRSRMASSGVRTETDARAVLREVLIEELHPDLDRSIKALPHDNKPSVLLVVGVNGTGKTTTVGKLARVLVADGRRVVLGAADTFRAAAAHQLQTWASRVGAEVVSGAEGADPASVAFDAVDKGIENGADVVVIDTAGRLHTKTGLMDELGKVKRVVSRRAEVDEVLLVLDATIGQNGLPQARVFAEVVDITGVVLTKLDGTAKGGIVFRVQQELGVPVKLVGLGEGPDDLAPFEPAAFVDALLG